MNTANLEAQFLARTGQTDDADAKALGRLNRAIESLGTNSLSPAVGRTPGGRTEAPAGDLRVPPPGMEPEPFDEATGPMVSLSPTLDAVEAARTALNHPCPGPVMKKCKLCGQGTTGSVGAAGIRWSFICQPCKNAEDRAALVSLGAAPVTTRQVRALADVTDHLLDVIHDDMTHAQQRERAEALEAARETVAMVRKALGGGK